jgi:GGDEF domain-containing protein
MDSGTYEAMEPLTRQDPIEGLARALDAHRGWLEDVHRALACRGASTDAVLSRLEGWCQLGRLLAHRAADGTGGARWRELSALHRRVHRLGRDVAQTAAEDGEIAPAVYDAFAEASDRLLASLVRIERASREEMSEIDTPTGVLSQRAMHDRLEIERSRARRSGRPCAIGVIVVLGSDGSEPSTVGDRALAIVAQACTRIVRPYDLVSRDQSDTLLVCFPETPEETADALLRHRLGIVTMTAEVTTVTGVAALHDADSVVAAIDRARNAALESRGVGSTLS